MVHQYRKRRHERQIRRWYIRPVNLYHQQFGQYHEFIRQLRSCDPQWYFNYIRLTPDQSETDFEMPLNETTTSAGLSAIDLDTGDIYSEMGDHVNFEHSELAEN
uniref:Uncharacterized protein n=1 Tax=Romanomermis culicivorax TaxID=13658 RepID=A0A915KDB4_ROMCU